MDNFRKVFPASFGAVVIVGAVLRVFAPKDVSALANPLTKGLNFAITAPNNVPRQITANGMNCAITIHVDINPRDGGASPTTQVCSGYSTTAVPLTKWNCTMPVCTDTTPGKCDGNWVVRDTAPGAISILAIDAPTDAGVPVRVELGSGCVTTP